MKTSTVQTRYVIFNKVTDKFLGTDFRPTTSLDKAELFNDVTYAFDQQQENEIVLRVKVTIEVKGEV